LAVCLVVPRFYLAAPNCYRIVPSAAGQGTPAHTPAREAFTVNWARAYRIG